jgi:23S rRNA pseudouridine2605 synthase
MKKKSTQFDKFTKKKSNAAIKEQFKQEKRKIKKEREEYFDKKRAEARQSFSPAVSSRQSGSQQSAAGGRQPGGQSSIKAQPSNELMPLNKFIAHSGVCSRRDAAEMIKLGKVKVNNELVTEPGHKVSAKDEIKVNGKRVFPAKDLVYILLNKPKDYITTTDDPQKRKTVLDLIRRATNQRVYPVGRLDRNTSGVLLLTNDGELAQKLTHPSHEMKKVYAVTLDRPLDKKDFDQILKGVTLEDGPASVDVLAYADAKDKTQLGVEIHSGRNRIVRRIFEHLGYDVRNLDRVIFAGLTKKNVERGKWRFLSEKEVRELKYFGKGK